MGFRSNKVVLMKAISELKDADYSREPELNGIYRRLLRGRKQFAEIFDKNIKTYVLKRLSFQQNVLEKLVVYM